jgi:hypothetical protein
MMKRHRKQTGFNASALQVHRAYLQHFGHYDESKPFDVQGQEIVAAMGLEAARAFILSMSNDPSIPFSS